MDIKRQGPLIQAKNIVKIFGNQKALNNVSLEIGEGDVLCIIGPSGSGKSTFLRCLNLLEVPDSGQIFFEGVDITDKKVDINRHRQKMGMVFQLFHLFPHLTVMKNLTLAPMKLLGKSAKEAENEARQLLKRVGLADREDAYPDQLSGG